MNAKLLPDRRVEVLLANGFPEKAGLPLVVLRTQRIRANLQQQRIDFDAVATRPGFIRQIDGSVRHPLQRDMSESRASFSR